MFCRKCGAAIEDNASFCSACGASINAESTTQYDDQQPQFNQEPINLLGMKWYKFLIYFALFASAVFNFVSGIRLVTGSVYGGSASYVYALFGGLQAIDVVVGLLTCVLAGLAIYTRFRLAGYYANGPKLMTLLYIGVLAINIIYIIGLAAVVPGTIFEELNFTSYIANSATAIIMIFVNNTYFKNRSHLFVK